MDDSERIAKAGAQVENMQRDINRLYDSVDRLREHMDKGFSDIRKELAVTTRWLVALTLLIVGLYGRMFGLY